MSAVLVYPQLESGALSQFPVRKEVTARTVVNAAADGSCVKYADAAGGHVEWELQYRGLGDSELAALAAFHAAAEGSLNAFTFVDPCGNLAAWSEELRNGVWQPGPHVTLSGDVADPLGGSGAWTLANTGAGPQSMLQTLNAPGGYVYSSSLWVRSATTRTVTLLLGSGRVECGVSGEWERVWISCTGDCTAAQVTFGLELPAWASVDVFGFQVEAQGRPSGYRRSNEGGVYDGARFRDDAFEFTTEAPNRHSATVRVVHANHF